jgi:hypothetical protein
MSGYRFNLVRFAIGSVLVTVMVLFLTWLFALLGAGWPSRPRLVGEIIVGVVVMEAVNAAVQEVLFWRNKARESEGK